MSAKIVLPKCRFCQREWKPPPGVTASEDYCSACSPQRQAIARQDFEADGKVPIIRGKFMLRVRPEAVVPDDVLVKRPVVDPIKCRCGELRQAGAKGWRFGTCEDGEAHWQCPECVEQGREPEPR